MEPENEIESLKSEIKTLRDELKALSDEMDRRSEIADQNVESLSGITDDLNRARQELSVSPAITIAAVVIALEKAGSVERRKVIAELDGLNSRLTEAEPIEAAGALAEATLALLRAEQVGDSALGRGWPRYWAEHPERQTRSPDAQYPSAARRRRPGPSSTED